MSRNSETASAKLNLALHVRERMPDVVEEDEREPADERGAAKPRRARAR